MKEEFIEFYKNELGVWNLVYKNMSKWLLFVYILVFITLSFIFMRLIFASNLYLMLIPLGLLVIEGAILNRHNKLILEKKHNILRESQGVFWGGLPLTQRKLDILKRFVYRRLDSEEQLKKIINVLNKEAELRKFTGIFVRGLGVGLFLPVWNYFIRWIFANEVNDINESLEVFLSIGILILLIIFVASMVKMVVMDFFDRESTRIKELTNMLETISIENLDFKKKII
ncbi:hypothetical protein [Bacillus sp. KH172YL63]|uniref:hypothetical protein n=1 Tax=Bacillus sp. KH172YL63 TaxID=2709784 RepID=UPI0013E421EC|nr:hypothetical protein [Bacillus sp. KH172YL63]BCB04087.1 hypothetical protein KH172YL63_22200 [Bacillus sp. KH172YL63]